jgi:dethiobiotin synthetase
MNLFVTAIDTDSGKTLSSAILCEALEADYWKPIQAGLPRDLDTVLELVSNSKSKFYNETYLLKTPASPHAAAKLESIEIKISDFQVPVTSRNLVIEGAGGCLVPINEKDFVIDLIPVFRASVILVADLYLGSINHTLLTLEALQKRNLDVRGIIFNGEGNYESEQIILRHSQLKCLLKIRPEENLGKDVVKKYASQFLENWHE